MSGRLTGPVSPFLSLWNVASVVNSSFPLNFPFILVQPCVISQYYMVLPWRRMILLYHSYHPLVSVSSQAGTKVSCTGLRCCYLITPGSAREVADIWVQWGEAYGHSPWLQDTAESAATNGWNHTVSINASQESHTWMISLAGKTVLGMLLSWKKICWCKWLCVAVDSIWTGITAFPTALRLWDEVSGQVMNISSSAVHQYTC